MFAQSRDAKAFLRLLMHGIDAISDPPETHQHLCEYFDPDPKKPDHIYCNRGGYLPRIDFDPTEFGIPPSALEATDTSQLLGLVVAKQALEDAGYGNDKGRSFDRSRTSVILGVTGTQELVIPLGARLGHPTWRRALMESGIDKHKAEEVIERISQGFVSWQENSFPGLLGNVVAGRIANRLDLGGTNCVVDAACASSMSAIHMAIMELSAHRSDMVLTGGVDTINDAFMHMCFSKTHILSATGDIRPFSQNADGTALGEGIGMVVLKRLDDAQRDGDRIYAVIKGLGSASDGKSQSIYAPRESGQALALRRAYDLADVAPESIELVEAHGTGTRVGDQVEFKALCEVFGAKSSNGNRCALGSVKSNIGHTKAAAGTAGLIKTALSLYHKIIPPTLKAQPVDAKLGVEQSPFYINHNLRPWPAIDGQIRRAGVSAFGFGGSNFHAVLEEYDQRKGEPSWNGDVEIVAFSAATKPVLADQLRQFEEEFSSNHTTADLNLIARLAAQSRQTFDINSAHRLLMLVFSTDKIDILHKRCEEARQKLQQEPKPATPSDAIFLGSEAHRGAIAFMFPGQGSQYIGMGRDLVNCFPASLEAFQEAQQNLAADYPLNEYVFPRMAGEEKSYEERLRHTAIAQPAIGAISVAMLEALAHFGITPAATCGHSYGELVALYAAGWIDRQTLWKLSTARGRLMAQAGETTEDAGKMLAVSAPLDQLAQMVKAAKLPVVLANRNSPSQGVLSGASAAIDAIEAQCQQKGWKCVGLPVAAAFHSHLVADAQIPFAEVVDKIAITPGAIPVMSNSRGHAYPADANQAKTILGAQLARPVDFVADVEQLYAQGIRTFIEVGPKSILTRLVQTTLQGREFNALALDRSNGRQKGLVDLASLIAQLAAWGYPVRLDQWEKPLIDTRTPRMRVPLSGANYRNPVAPMRAKPVQAGSHQKDIDNSAFKMEPVRIKVPVPNNEAPAHGVPPAIRPQNQNTKRPQGPIFQREVMDNSNKNYLTQALGAVQQSLAAMQALQAQTTQAHQKYLETQTEAQRTLQQMVHSTQQLTAAFMGGKGLEFSVPAPLPRINSTVTKELKPLGTVNISAPSSTPNPAPQIASHPKSATPIPANNPPSAVDTASSTAFGAAPSAAIADSLISIVSQLTGYPTEMLGLDMDIESDLGIDSIKRVEILSALEEKMPHLPKVTPDLVGTLKTLGQICDYLNAGASKSTSATVLPENRLVAANPAIGSTSSGTLEIQGALITIVSQLTGYPTEMLGLEMDIESDLGIDSIKRVEILSALEEKMPHLPKVTPDLVGSLKTLGQICGYLSNNQPPTSATVPVLTPNTTKATPLQSDEPTQATLPRYEIKIIDRPLVHGSTFCAAPEQMVAIVSEDESSAYTLTTALSESGCPARHFSVQEDLADATQLAGLVLMAPIAAQEAFRWAQRCAPHLQKASQCGPAIFHTVTQLDGAFGFSGRPLNSPEQGALAGLVKTAALEWPAVRCRAYDIACHWTNPEQAYKSLAQEIIRGFDEPSMEIGLSPDTRIGLDMVSTTVPSFEGIDLKPDDVVVVSGGGRGVTAAATLALAAQSPCGIALLGRSPHPHSEPEWLMDLLEEGQIKQAILRHEFKDRPASPKVLEQRYRQLMANREILTTLNQLSQLGVKVNYYSQDVAQTAALQDTMALIRKNMGPIKALIHGAGVLEDRLIVDKTMEQFQSVYQTKVGGLLSLLKATKDDHLRYLVLFSSVSARMGNVGQVDYSMANEAINKLALQESHVRTNCKVIAINWGPWDGGMVTPSLRRNFESHGIPLIPLRAGAKALVAEMGAASNGSVEVVIGGALRPESSMTITPPKTVATTDCHEDTLSQTAKREIDLDRCPVLQSHMLDGRPVVPLALITEWLAHGALHANPGLVLHGMDHLRLLKGITLDEPAKTIRLMAGSPKRKEKHYEVDVQIRGGGQNGHAQVHSSAKAILTDRLPSAPAFEENGHFKRSSKVPSLEQIYDQVLFHGDHFRGIQQIIRLSKHGMTAKVLCAPPPEKWLNEPLRSRWIADPLVLDCAFQMAIVWCHQQKGVVSLPSYAAAYRQYRDRFPTEGVSAVMEVIQATDRKLIADFTFLDQEKQIIARMSGYEAIMDKGLFRAFGIKVTEQEQRQASLPVV